MSAPIKIALAQINPLVGDLVGNADLMRLAAHNARHAGAQVVVFPELSLTGYPPEDLLLLPGFVHACEMQLQQLAQETDTDLLWLVGALGRDDKGRLTNEAVALGRGRVLARYAKQVLPNYGVFDEQRYFAPGSKPVVVDWHGVKLGLLVCEDLWQALPARQAQQAGADLIVSLHASPYEVGKGAQRLAMARTRVRETGLPLVYVNQIGGQDALVFDGRSFVMDVDGSASQLPLAQQVCALANWQGASWHCQGQDWQQPLPEMGEQPNWGDIWQMLVLGLRDYVRKNGFSGVLLGLSGGIDSALVLALAVDALGHEAVEAVMMPFVFTSDISRQDAAEQAQLLGVRYTELPIGNIYNAVTTTLAERFMGLPKDVTEENLQARIRGLLLMAISNKSGRLLLSTSNKSESAVGYATLYGDMSGGLAPLKDVPKTWVYALANWRNAQGRVIPQRVIDRPPSAELRANQKDQDSLPPYEVLDLWLWARMEQGADVEQLARLSHTSVDDPWLVKSLRLLRLAEYKRRQAAPGIKVTGRSFDRDWRMPITNGWKG